MQSHRWWLASVVTLLTPWIGPHIDQYVPVGWVLFQAGAEEVERSFWIIAAVVLGVIYTVWLVLFSALFAWLARRRRAQGNPSGSCNR